MEVAYQFQTIQIYAGYVYYCICIIKLFWEVSWKKKLHDIRNILDLLNNLHDEPDLKLLKVLHRLTKTAAC